MYGMDLHNLKVENLKNSGLALVTYIGTFLWGKTISNIQQGIKRNLIACWSYLIPGKYTLL